jgi:hypothetical protein
MAKTLALSQPVLQSLWEAQQTFGAVTDQTTQSILDQAVQQGLVGAQFKSVNEKILDVLLAINKVLGGEIPAAFAGLSGVAATAGADITKSVGGSLKGLGIRARDASDEISKELAKIKTPDLTVDVKLDLDASDFDVWSENYNRRSGVTPLAAGGIVRRPTLALVGESGPEAVVPLNRLASVIPASSDDSTRGGDVYLDGERVGRIMLKAIADEAYHLGLVPR